MNLDKVAKDFEVIEIIHNKQYVVTHKPSGKSTDLLGDYSMNDLKKAMIKLLKGKSS